MENENQNVANDITAGGLDQDQTEKLLHFQDITNIEDLEECKRIMNSHNWNVETAVQSTLPGFNPLPTPSSPPPQPLPMLSRSQYGLRRRNFGTAVTSSLPMMPSRVYEARRTVASRQPQGLWGWSYHIITLPFRWTWITLSGFIKLFIRLFVIDPRMRIVNPLSDVRDFIKEYEELFGTRHPNFFVGTYADAQNEARRQLRFLLVYLHDPSHADTDEFCRTTMSNSDVIDLVNNNFVFWSCSILKPEGYRVSKAMRENAHPFLAMICLIRGKLTIVGRLEGALTSLEFLEQVSMLIERFEPELTVARADRAERDMTQLLRNEQDAAYQKSLLEDKVKEEKRKQDEKLRLEEEEEIAAKNRLKEERDHKQMIRRQSCKNLLAEEPKSDHPDAVKLVIKLPDGSRLTRTFLSTEPVKVVHDYIYSQDNAPRRFQVTTNFPRRVIPRCSTMEILEEEEKNTEPRTESVEGCSKLGSTSGFSISEAGLKHSEMLFVQAIESDDEDL